MRRLSGSIGAALFALLAVGAATAQQRVPVSPDLVERAAAEGAVRVIVELDVATRPEGHLPTPAARASQRSVIAAAQSSLLAALAGFPHRVTGRFRAIPFVALEVGPEALAALELSSEVVAVQQERLHRPMLNVSVPLVEGDQAVALGFDGAGQTVVVLDTGADPDHPNLAGQIVDEACFARGDPFGSGDCPNGGIFDDGPGSGSHCTFSGDCFHGTHVAGIAVGSGASFSGVAPGATLIPIQIFSRFTGRNCSPGSSPCALSWTSDQIDALEYVFNTLRFAHAIASINMSLGGGLYDVEADCDFENAATKAAIDNLRSVGIATVAAAGNNGCGSAGCVNAMSSPGCISSAVSVSATDDNDQIALFSNAASFLELWAPGVDITAPLYKSTGFTEASGTSMSTPHVAGAWAILRQAAPVSSVDAILAAFQQTGPVIDDVHVDTTRIDVHEALAQFLAACSNGFDDDQDGLVDFPSDPGCMNPASSLENPQCDDDVDNDGDGKIDWDGGSGGGAIDPECSGKPWRNRERAKSSCGLGFELALLLPPLLCLHERRRRRLR